MMTTVLRILPDLVTDPRLTAYVERCTARPAAARLAASGSAWAVARYETVVVGRSWPSIFCTSHSDIPRS